LVDRSIQLTATALLEAGLASAPEGAAGMGGARVVAQAAVENSE